MVRCWHLPSTISTLIGYVSLDQSNNGNPCQDERFSKNGKWYFTCSGYLSFEDAKKLCESHNAYLAEPQDDEVAQLFKAKFKYRMISSSNKNTFSIIGSALKTTFT